MGKFFSIAIPTYEMNGRGSEFLDFSLSQIYSQEFKDFEVIISDNSVDDSIYKVYKNWIDKIDIKYFKNDFNKNDNPSSNINNAILNSSGSWIKVLFLDDFLLPNSLMSIYNCLNIKENENKKWIVVSCLHTINSDTNNLFNLLNPRWNDDMHIGHNSIGSPSVLCIKNDDGLELFDENFKWLMDCDLYRRYKDKYDLPIFLHYPCVAIRIWQNQLTNKLDQSYKDSEVELIKIKYKH